MAQLTITLELDSAAFDPEPGPEVARILGHLAEGLRAAPGRTYEGISEGIAVRDINGNTIGQMTITA